MRTTRYTVRPQVTPKPSRSRFKTLALLDQRNTLSNRLVRSVVRRLTDGRPWLVHELAEEDPDLSNLIDAGEASLFPSKDDGLRMKVQPSTMAANLDLDATMADHPSMMDRPDFGEESVFFGETAFQAALRAIRARNTVRSRERRRKMGYLLVDEVMAGSVFWKGLFTVPTMSPQQTLAVSSSLAGLFSMLAEQARMQVQADLDVQDSPKGDPFGGYAEGNPFGEDESESTDDFAFCGDDDCGICGGGEWEAATEPVTLTHETDRGEAGDFWFKMPVDHDFQAESITFEGSSPSLSILHISAGGRTVYRSPKGTLAAEFSSLPVLRPLIAGVSRAVGPGVSLTAGQYIHVFAHTSSNGCKVAMQVEGKKLPPVEEPQVGVPGCLCTPKVRNGGCPHHGFIPKADSYGCKRSL